MGIQVDHLFVQSIPIWGLAGSWPVSPLGVLAVFVLSVLVSILMLLSSPIGSDQSFVNIHQLSVSARPRVTDTVMTVTGAGLVKHHHASHNLNCSSPTEIALVLTVPQSSHNNQSLLNQQQLKLQNHLCQLLLHQHQHLLIHSQSLPMVKKAQISARD